MKKKSKLLIAVLAALASILLLAYMLINSPSKPKSLVTAAALEQKCRTLSENNDQKLIYEPVIGQIDRSEEYFISSKGTSKELFFFMLTIWQDKEKKNIQHELTGLEEYQKNYLPIIEKVIAGAHAKTEDLTRETYGICAYKVYQGPDLKKVFFPPYIGDITTLTEIAD